MYICKQSGPGWTPSSDPFALAALLSTGIVGVCHSARVCVGGVLGGVHMWRSDQLCGIYSLTFHLYLNPRDQTQVFQLYDKPF